MSGRMAFRLYPRDEQFFDLFSQMAAEIKTAAGFLDELFAASPPDLTRVDLIKDTEHRCDALTHDTIQRLHRTFVTPFDREDIYAMATSLDNVMDAIDHAATLLALYGIQTVRPDSRELVRGVSASAERLNLALGALSGSRPVHPHAVEINRLENEADRAYQESVRLLFESERDPILIMKWKEIYDNLERITDCCEDVANVVEGIVVKHG
jgi:predicted phosphate transport protein (TIGR00153 family)